MKSGGWGGNREARDFGEGFMVGFKMFQDGFLGFIGEGKFS